MYTPSLSIKVIGSNKPTFLTDTGNDDSHITTSPTSEEEDDNIGVTITAPISIHPPRTPQRASLPSLTLACPPDHDQLTSTSVRLTLTALVKHKALTTVTITNNGTTVLFYSWQVGIE